MLIMLQRLETGDTQNLYIFIISSFKNGTELEFNYLWAFFAN